MELDSERGDDAPGDECTDTEVRAVSAAKAGRARWPEIPVEGWRQTRDTLHLYTQVVGKVVLAHSPAINHWWNTTLRIDARGFTTVLVPHPGGASFQIRFDLAGHRLEILTTTGGHRSLDLDGGDGVAGFYARVTTALDDLGVGTPIWPMPVEIKDAVPFTDDDVHTVYDPDAAWRFWQALVQMERVFDIFRARFLGKSSPVHLFWGALDLALTRFSGATAPPHPGGAPNCGPHVMHEAYSHEASSCGYWADHGVEGAFYAYAYPEPDGYRTAPVAPAGATYDASLGEFVLPYEAVRTSPDPDAALLDFLQSTYEAAADNAGWDRPALERRPVARPGGPR